MLNSFKTELNPTKEQRVKINQTIGTCRFPNFKKKGESDVKMYFVKNNPNDCRCERHRIHLPTLGWIRLKEKGYLPTTKDGYVIKSGTISIKAGRYYVSTLVAITDTKITSPSSEGLGIDLGIKDLAIVSNGKTYKNINQSERLKKLEKQLRRGKDAFPANMRVSRKESPLKERIYKNKIERYRNFIIG